MYWREINRPDQRHAGLLAAELRKVAWSAADTSSGTEAENPDAPSPCASCAADCNLRCTMRRLVLAVLLHHTEPGAI